MVVSQVSLNYHIASIEDVEFTTQCTIPMYL